ncbi:MAG: class I SAM-dependent methyltransferase [Ktedonobacteraceae bacterium]
MSQLPKTTTPATKGITSHRCFAKYYERMSRSSAEERFLAPLRREVTGQARGQVLEVGAGNGLNFAFYQPDRVERVEAIEPDSAMLTYARERAAVAHVPINLVQAPVENLPFADESFESAVVTLVFCSVNDPRRGLSDVRRVLKPGGALLMVEHVRARGAIAATMQNIITPITQLMAGNCHWNRETEKAVIEAGFKIEQRRDLAGFMLPFVVLQAVK